MIENNENFPWIIVDLHAKTYAVSCENVSSIVTLDDITTVPVASNHIRGVINLRGKIIPCTDLRLFLGMKSMTEEFASFDEMLHQKEKDHVNWLNELRLSIQEKRAFELTTDPHACAFGKWYDSFKSDNIVITETLRKFDTPHQIIHGIASTVKELEAKGNFTEAMRLIEETEGNELKEMINLFANMKNNYRERNRETVIIVENNEKYHGIIVDKILSIEPLLEGSIGKVDINNAKSKFGKRVGDQSLVLLLDPEDLLNPEEFHRQDD